MQGQRATLGGVRATKGGVIELLAQLREQARV